MSSFFPFKETFSESERKLLLLGSLSIFASIVLIIFSISILPEYCSVFSRNELNGLACDGMRDFTLDPCPICKDKSAAVGSSILLGLGLGFMVLPFAINYLQKLRNRPSEKVELFPN